MNAWRRLLAVDSRDDDVVRRGQSFITLCLTFASVTAFLSVPIGLAYPLESLPIAMTVLGLVICNYVGGAWIARCGRVDLAGMVVGAALSSTVALFILLRFHALNDGMWFMVLSVVIAGIAVRPRLIWLIVGLDLAWTTLFLILLPEDPAQPFYNFYRVMILDALLVTTAVAEYISATRSHDLFQRQRSAVAELESASHTAELSREQAEQAYQLAAAANRAKSRFLANMSHELRTPLNAIIGYTELLIEQASEAPHRADLERIDGAAHHLLALISDILDLTKIEAGRLGLVPENFAVEALAGQVAQAVAPIVAQNRNTLTVAVAPECGEVHTDRTRLRQIVLNLLVNAAKFTRGGHIRLRCRREGQVLVFEVHDTGIGMDDATLARMFADFVQADDSTTRRYGGTGLGLSLSRQLAAMLGGSLSATSTPGEGSTFVLRVPGRLALAIAA